MTANPAPFRAAFIARALMAYRRRALAMVEQARRVSVVSPSTTGRGDPARGVKP
jgi:hypothetical protein